MSPATLPPTPRMSPWLLALLVLALLPRLVLVGLFLDLPLGLDDMYQYDMLGRSLASGQGYRWYGRQDVQRLRPYLDRYYGIDLPSQDIPEEGYLTTFRPPGYPIFLASIYTVAGEADRLAAVRWVQAVLGALLAPATALLALALGLPPLAAGAAGVALALYPILWIYPIGLGSENLFLPLLLFGLLLALRAMRSGKPALAAAAGGVLGYATLTRGSLVLFLPLAAAALLRRTTSSPRPTPPRWVPAGAFLAAAAVALLPWSVRNSLLLGRPAFVDNSAGYNLYVGYHPESDGGFTTAAAVQPLRFLDDGQRDRWSTTQALGFMRNDPGRAIYLLASRLAHFWGLEDRELVYFYSNGFLGEIPQPWLGMAYLWLVIPWVATCLAAPWGMAWAAETRSRALALALIGASLAVYVPILAEPRFHLPVVPIMAAYAGAAWMAPGGLRRALAGLRGRQPTSWLALAAMVALLSLMAWDALRDLPRLTAVLAAGGSQLDLGY